MRWDTLAANIARVAAISLSLFHLYTGYDGTFYPYVQRAVPLMLAVVIVFLTMPARVSGAVSGAPSANPRVGPLGWLLAAAAIPAFGYVAVYSDYLTDRWPMTPSFAPTVLQVCLAVAASVLLLEASRRLMGLVLVLICGAALLYAQFGDLIAWRTIAHRGFTFLQIVDHMYLTQEGIWGSALGIAATYIVLFVIFGAFAERAGTSNVLIDLTTALAGHLKGGPAKVAIISSGLTGSVTGSSVANVYTTGQFTIPLMMKLGYRPPMAAAVEALASNGGQIMPPVMGAAAFILAANANVSYAHVTLASLIPAIIYYAGLYWHMHLEADKTGLKGMPSSEKPALLAVLMGGWHLLLPLILLITLFAYGNSPMQSAFLAICATVVVSWVRKDTRMGPRSILDALERGGKDATMILIICAAIGFVIGAFTLTGLGLNISSALISLSGGNFVLLLVLVALACLVLGTGMNTVAAFLLVAIVAVPILRERGVDMLVANMFVFYAALLSHITPPVCLAVFAAASIANTSSWTTAFEGMRMGVIAYLLPFIIVFYPSLLLQGSPLAIALDTMTVLVGIMAISCAVQGWLMGRLRLVERLWASIAGCLLLWPTPHSTATGGAMAAALFVWALVGKRRLDARARPAAAE
jgi:TRAP transporter 4TM/12TM fusion protein